MDNVQLFFRITSLIVTVVTVVIVTVVTVVGVTVVIVTYLSKKKHDTLTTDEMFSGQGFAILAMFLVSSL